MSEMFKMKEPRIVEEIESGAIDEHEINIQLNNLFKKY